MFSYTILFLHFQNDYYDYDKSFGLQVWNQASADFHLHQQQAVLKIRSLTSLGVWGKLQVDTLLSKETKDCNVPLHPGQMTS